MRVPCFPSAFQGTERVGVDAGDALASVQGVFLSQGDRLFDESKYSLSSFSACAGLRSGAPQFTDAIASSTTMKARAILAAYWVKAIGVARLMSSAIDLLMIGLAAAPSLRTLRRAHASLAIFWTGATHVVQLRP